MRILTSLAENDYFLGLSALINSVVRGDKTFFDHIVVGFRGELPTWLPAMKDGKYGKCTAPLVDNGPTMEFVNMNHDSHMVHEKPRWFLRLSRELYPDADEFFFFDSDVVVVQRMSFFSEWLRHGVALCEDVNWDMSEDHPIRLQWASFAEANGMEVRNERTRYYNSGFIGWKRETEGFLEDWVGCLDLLSPHCGDIKRFRALDRSYSVLSANQDSLNLATMITSHPISTMGAEAMGFSFGFRLMTHPIGADAKPWKRAYALSFLKGHGPTLADLEYWRVANNPAFSPYPKGKVQRKYWLCRSLRLLSRFYGGFNTTGTP